MKSFFILSNPRSGSSLLRLMLNSHPNICVPPECGFVQWLYPQAIRDADGFVQALRTCRKIETWHLDFDALALRLRTSQPQTHAGFCESVYRFYGAGKDLKVWGDKNNYYIGHMDLLEEVFPHTLYIHLVRDGRDVACSYKNVMRTVMKSVYAPRLATDLGKIAEEWSKNVLAVESHFSRIADSRHVTVRYEDLIADPQRVLGLLCEFLAVVYSDEMLHYYAEGKHDEPAETMEWKLKTKKPIDPANRYRYRKELSPDELRAFSRRAGTALRRFGYPVGNALQNP